MTKMFLGEFGLMLLTALLKDHVKFRNYECNYKPHSHKHINCANVACFFYFILYKSISGENYVFWWCILLPVTKGWTLVTGFERLGWAEGVSVKGSLVGLTVLSSGAGLALELSSGLALSRVGVSTEAMSSSVTETTSIFSGYIWSVVPCVEAWTLKSEPAFFLKYHLYRFFLDGISFYSKNNNNNKKLLFKLLINIKELTLYRCFILNLCCIFYHWWKCKING